MAAVQTKKNIKNNPENSVIIEGDTMSGQNKSGGDNLSETGENPKDTENPEIGIIERSLDASEKERSTLAVTNGSNDVPIPAENTSQEVEESSGSEPEVTIVCRKRLKKKRKK